MFYKRNTEQRRLLSKLRGQLQLTGDTRTAVGELASQASSRDCNMHMRWYDITRKPSWRKGYARQRPHSKMVVSRHLGYYRTGNIIIRSADSENPNLEPNMEWIGCTVCEIFAFKVYCDLETRVGGHSRSSQMALFDRAHTTLYSSSIVTMPL